MTIRSRTGHSSVDTQLFYGLCGECIRCWFSATNHSLSCQYINSFNRQMLVKIMYILQFMQRQKNRKSDANHGTPRATGALVNGKALTSHRRYHICWAGNQQESDQEQTNSGSHCNSLCTLSSPFTQTSPSLVLSCSKRPTHCGLQIAVSLKLNQW